MNLFNVLQASGGCQFGFLSTTEGFMRDSLSTVTGYKYSQEEVMNCGERIANIRQAFNVREGINIVETPIPMRAYGNPPLSDGPVADVTVQIGPMVREFLEDMDWDLENGVPKENRLRELNLDFLLEDMRKLRNSL